MKIVWPSHQSPPATGYRHLSDVPAAPLYLSPPTKASDFVYVYSGGHGGGVGVGEAWARGVRGEVREVGVGGLGVKSKEKLINFSGSEAECARGFVFI